MLVSALLMCVMCSCLQRWKATCHVPLPFCTASVLASHLIGLLANCYHSATTTSSGGGGGGGERSGTTSSTRLQRIAVAQVHQLGAMAVISAAPLRPRLEAMYGTIVPRHLGGSSIALSLCKPKAIVAGTQADY